LRSDSAVDTKTSAAAKAGTQISHPTLGHSREALSCPDASQLTNMTMQAVRAATRLAAAMALSTWAATSRLSLTD
jgi:hypothetical protein